MEQAERVYFDGTGLTLCLLGAGSQDSGQVSFESLLGEDVPASRAFAGYQQCIWAGALQGNERIEADWAGAAIADFLPDGDGVFAFGGPDLARQFHTDGTERVFNQLTIMASQGAGPLFAVEVDPTTCLGSRRLCYWWCPIPGNVNGFACYNQLSE
jgi:hypothetical protein